MINTPDFARIRPVSASPDGWFDYTLVATAGGAMAPVCVDRDFQRLEGGEAWPAWQGARLLLPLHTRDGSETSVAAPTPPFPLVDRLPDGGWIIVGARAAPDEANAFIYGPDGRLRTSFHAGDAVEALATSQDGKIWLGYFDEGIYGEDPLSQHGLVCFDMDGVPIWRHDNSVIDIADCYALSTSGAAAWACPYDAFPVLRITDGAVRSWDCPTRGAHAICANGDHVILAGGYRDEYDRVMLLRLEETEARPLAEVRLTGLERERRRLRGGEGVMSIFQDRMVIELHIKDWLGALNRA